ncbi:signal transduction histidine kinase/DNA-binding NarL/FixJ family response regulator [Novosphingobium sp. SG751A]|uniref:ATP-binding protein n=1 Tax=Novosphingobium sp. SG751A TaxID=2587000 RepID=UPI001556233C|nr:ATP-binding protein [Novosphingobium sp. SG751A]NOW44698.1 signal transduction histidine kinase/DNA-binding NarL/FixJ family response regulator [Novosphingobium sp. SG751A]
MALLRYLHNILNSQGYAPHGFCLLWQPELIWTHVTADAITALAYFTIPIALVMLVRRRGDIAFSWVFICFAVFILACGATHIISIITLWYPIYGIQALVKALTAVVSVATAAAFWPLMPKLLAIPSPTQLRLANEALATRVLERDAAIEQLQAEIAERKSIQAQLAERSRELDIARSVAESASQAKSNFLANMSHELRTPLNAVMGYAQLMMREKGIEERHQHAARTIHDSGQHLLTLINDILDLSKIEAGKLELYPTSTDLRGFLKGIAAIMRVRTEEKALDFVCDLAPDLPDFVLADEKRLRQVLLNLLGNAVKFTDRGRVTLGASVLMISGQSVRLSFSVRDTGVGIAQEELPAIFKPFEQVGANDKRSGGTGLGLSISRQLIELMDSALKVESVVGEGSLFWFDLDLAISHRQSGGDVNPAECTGYRGDRRRILIVDDITANREVLAALLVDLGFAVEQSPNAQEGIAQAIASLPDLIMMDIRMPGMDGLEAIQALGEHKGLRHVPVIAVSSGISPQHQSAALAAGARSFLPKPLDRAEMIRLVGEAIGVEWTIEQAEAKEEAMTIPPADVLGALHAAAAAGNMRAVRGEAERIAALDTAYRAFAETITRMARAFQSQALLALIETSMEEQA